MTAVSRRLAWVEWLSLTVIVAIAVLRCVVFFAPSIVFDSDPARVPGTISGLGPAGSLWLDAILLLACAAGLGATRRRGDSIDWWLFAPALIPAAVVAWHGRDDLADLWIGANWLAAMVAAATIAQLARDRRRRIAAFAVLIAVSGPLLARGVANVTFEHDQTVAQFESQRDAMFRDRGWTPDSANAQIFERRLRQRQPTGWFLTTNIFGTLVAAIGLALAAMTVGAVRRGVSSGWYGLTGLASIASFAALAMTGSKAAIGLAVVCAGVIAMVGLVPTRLGSRRAFALGPVLLAVVLAGVFVRGVVLPESFANEKSLLFRWHYTVSAARIVGDSPVIGAGPGGFQTAYVRHRVPRNPEEVASAHSMLWDWLAGLGVPGLAWAVFVVVAIGRAGRRAATSDDDDEPSGVVGPALLVAVATTILALVPAVLLELRDLDGQDVLVRIIGMAALISVAGAAAYVLDRVPGRMAAIAAFGAALLVLMHGLVEMTIVLPGSGTWCLVIVGVAGWSRRRDAGRIDTLAPVVVLVLAAGCLIAGALPASRYETQLIEAARPLWPIARARQLVAAQAPGRVEHQSQVVATLARILDELGEPDLARQVERNGGVAPGQIEPILQSHEGRLRYEAAEKLAAAHTAWPMSAGPLVASARQYELASISQHEAEQARAHADDQIELAVTRYGDGHAMSLGASIHERRYLEGGDPADLDRAIELQRALVDIDPRSNVVVARLGDFLSMTDRRAEAASAYRQAIQNDDAFELDLLKQFAPVRRAEIESRIEELSP